MTMVLSDKNNKTLLSQYETWLNNVYPNTTWLEYYKGLKDNEFLKRNVQKNYLFTGDINFNAHVLKYIKSLIDKYDAVVFSRTKNLELNQYGCVMFDTYSSDVTNDMYMIEAISETWFEANEDSELCMYIPNIAVGLVTAEINDNGELIIEC